MYVRTITSHNGMAAARSEGAAENIRGNLRVGNFCTRHLRNFYYDGIRSRSATSKPSIGFVKHALAQLSHLRLRSSCLLITLHLSLPSRRLKSHRPGGKRERERERRVWENFSPFLFSLAPGFCWPFYFSLPRSLARAFCLSDSFCLYRTYPPDIELKEVQRRDRREGGGGGDNSRDSSFLKSRPGALVKGTASTKRGKKERRRKVYLGREFLVNRRRGKITPVLVWNSAYKKRIVEENVFNSNTGLIFTMISGIIRGA